VRQCLDREVNKDILEHKEVWFKGRAEEKVFQMEEQEVQRAWGRTGKGAKCDWSKGSRAMWEKRKSDRWAWPVTQGLETRARFEILVLFGAGDQTQGLTQAEHMFYHWVTPLTPLCFFCFCDTRVKLRASQLLSRYSTTWAMPPALFALVIFWIGSCVFAQVGLQMWSSYLFLPHSWNYENVP
jgi:hypothetical protein